MAIYHSTNPLDWYATDGTYVAEQDTPAGATIEGTNEVHLVGHFPWGSPDVVHSIGSTKEYVDKLIGKCSSPGDYSGVRALTGKYWPKLKIVRIDATGAVAASRTIGANGYTVTAKYKSAAGNQITTKHKDNGDDTFDVTISWNGYVKTHAGVALADVADLEDEYVDFAAAGTGDTIASSDASAVALSSGADGTPTDTDYLGGVSDVSGLRLLESEKDQAIVLLDEYTSAAAITALRNHAALKRAFVLCHGASGDFAANLAAVEAINDDRLACPLHQGRQLIDGVEVNVDLAPFAASMLAYMPPHFSLADEGYARTLLKNLIGPAAGVSLSRSSWIDADDAGGLMLEAMEGGGYKFHANITTSPTEGKELISTRRVKDIAIASVAKAIAPFQNKPGMPYYDKLALAQAKRTIEKLKGRPDTVPHEAILQGGGVVILDPVASNATTYQLALSLWGETRYQIINVTAGIDLVIEEILAAA